MRMLTTLAVSLPLVLGLSAAQARAAEPTGIVPQDGSATFRFATAVTTPKGKHSAGGTVDVKRTGTRSITLTVRNDDGSAPRTIPLILGVDGSIAPDPSGAAATSTQQPSAQAKAFMEQMTLAAKVGVGARKSAGAASYEVPLTLSPVGDGTTVSTQLAMTGSAAQYVGRAQGQTTTKLPQSGGLDPKELAKTVGVSAFAHHAFTPAGRAATAIVMRRKRKQEKEAAAGLLPDTVGLTVTADLTGGKIHEIRGVQTDTVTLENKPVTIESTWSFTKVPG